MHNDLLGGTLQFAIDTLTQNVPFIKDGKLRGLAVTSRARMGLAPELPTVAEAGFPRLIAENFLGISAPAGVPREVVDRVHRATSEVLANPDIGRRLQDMGIAMTRMSQPEFADFVAKQVAEWAPAVQASGARLN